MYGNYFGIVLNSQTLGSNYNLLTITNNKIYNNIWPGMVLLNCSNSYFESNYIYENGDEGIYLGSALNNTFTNNTAKSNNGSGIVLGASSNNTLINNTANSNSWSGIYLIDNSNFNNISNNKISNNTQGITMTNCNPWGCYGENINNTLQGNEISNNNIGIYSQNSSSIINSNTVCGNVILDFNSSNWLSSSGDNNTCDKPEGWNDDGINGCWYTCSGFSRICDLNQNGIIIQDYNDLMSAYKCFLGIENCNKINYQNWNLMKQEYECFTNINNKQ